jgi:hypothetical protein
MFIEEKNSFKRDKHCKICQQYSSFPLILFPDNYIKKIKSRSCTDFSIFKYFIKRSLYSLIFENYDKKRVTIGLQKLKYFCKKNIKINGVIKFIGNFLNKWLLKNRKKELNYLENIDLMMKILMETKEHPEQMEKDIKKILSCFKKKKKLSIKKN